ncbi:MAG: putative transport system ATP-binding protein, partial [Nocardioidaceae bacterium]|nr:putative transport system ATP-binding protein [Nocardioidaceae bacterium]
MADVVVEGLTVEYDSGGYKHRPLEGFDMQVADGELAVLVGPSGSGKTTLLSCLAGLLTPHSGSVRVAGTEVTKLTGRELDEHRRTRVGVVFQAFNLIPSLSARDNVAVPLRIAGWKRGAALARATELLERVGLAERLGHRPGKLSGGQQQR